MLSSQNKEAVMDDFGNNRGFTISGAIEFWKTKKWCSRIVTAQKSTDLEEPIITIFKNAKDKKNGKNGKTCTLTDFVALKKDFPLSGNNMTIAIVTLNFDLYLSFKNPLSQLLWYTWLKQNCPSFRTFDVQYLKGPNKLYQFEGRACNVYVTKLSFVVRCILSKGTQETLLQYYHQDLRLRRREDHVMEITVEATKQVYKLCGASVPMILKVCRNIVNCATDDRSDIDKYSEGYWLSSMPVLAVKDPEFYGGTLPRYTAYNPVQVVDGRRRSESAMHASLSQPGHTNVFEPSHNRLDRLSSTPQINTTTSLYKQNSKFSNSHIYPFYGKLRKFVVKSATSIAASDIQEERDYENVLPQKTNNYQVNDNQTQKLSLSQRLSKSVTNLCVNPDLVKNNYYVNNLPGTAKLSEQKGVDSSLLAGTNSDSEITTLHANETISAMQNTKSNNVDERKLSYKGLKKSVNKVLKRSLTGSFAKYDGDRKSLYSTKGDLVKNGKAPPLSTTTITFDEDNLPTKSAVDSIDAAVRKTQEKLKNNDRRSSMNSLGVRSSLRTNDSIQTLRINNTSNEQLKLPNVNNRALSMKLSQNVVNSNFGSTLQQVPIFDKKDNNNQSNYVNSEVINFCLKPNMSEGSLRQNNKYVNLEDIKYCY